MSAGRAVRFAVLGCGGIGRWHARLIRRLPGLELAALSDPDPVARAHAERKFSAPTYSSTTELLEREPVDVVSICTPPDTHVPLIEVVAEHGVHVLVEKPLALTVAQADRALEACARRGVHLGVVHQQRARSATRALHRLLGEGRLGRPVLAVLTHTWFRAPAQSGVGWRGDAAMGGGLLLEQGVHGIDLLIWMLGEPRWVSGATGALPAVAAEDTAVAVLGFDSGALATLAASTVSNLARDDIALEVAGTRGGFRLEIRDYDDAEIVRLACAAGSGDDRAVALGTEEIEELVRSEDGSWRGGPSAPLWRLVSRVAGPGRGVFPFRSPRAYLRRQADREAQSERAEPQGHAAVLAQMAAAARGEGSPLVTGQDARRTVAVIEAIHRSQAQDGARVELAALEVS